jgi:23S rRNA (cytidine1920-2'-O)/16S rRNA (cytidine1409-2'-O)-methyltransferase
MSRLDVWLAEHGLAESREKAQAIVMAGRVRVDGQPATKPGTRVREGSAVTVDEGPKHVGRGALKLEGALDALGVDPSGRVAVDVGASTGGFTETLLARGAARVYAVDVGRGQLHEKLRRDPRVVLRDRTNARRLSAEVVPEPCDLAVMDVSFISARMILGALATVVRPGADAVVLVKPQFEVGREQVGRGGLVKDAALHRQAVLEVAEASQRLGFGVRGACASPVAGAEGNREFFLHLVAGAAAMPGDELEGVVRKAVEP